MTHARRLTGLAYTLNRLDELATDGTLDPVGAARARARLTAELDALRRGTAPPVGRRPAPPVRTPPRPAHPSAAAAADRVLTTQAPSLLLYVGAFLLIVSALILVNISGNQIPDAVKLAMMLGGTAGFITAGLVCHRYPTVLPAGRTFLAIGALLVPIDIAATYALFLRQSPLTRPELWIGGSIVAATLYATLARTGYGNSYARGFFLATVSAVLALAEATRVPDVGWVMTLLVLAIGHAAAPRVVPPTSPWARLTGPLPPLAETLTILSLGAGAILSLGFAEENHRLDAAMIAALGTASFALAVGRHPERIAMLTGIGVTLVAVLRLARPEDWVYGIALLGLALAYGPVADRVEALPVTLRTELRAIGYAWLALAFAMVWTDRTPALAGVFVFGGGVAHLAALEARHGAAPGARVGPRPSFGREQVRVFAAAAVLHLVGRDVLLSVPSPALRAAVSGWRPEALAVAFFPAGLLLGSATLAAIRRGAPQRHALAASAVASAALVMLLASGDPARLAPIAVAYAVIAIVIALGARIPGALWVAGGLGAIALLASYESSHVMPHLRATRLLALGVSAYAIASTARDVYARAVRETALGGILLAAVVGVIASEQRPAALDAVDTPGWAVAVAALLLLAVTSLREARLRRRFELAVGSGVAAIAGIEMQVARLHPQDVQAYTVPLAVFAIGGALLALRYGPRDWHDIVPPAEVVGVLVLLVPTYVATWSNDGFGHGIRILAECLVLLWVGVLLRQRILVAGAVAFLSLDTLRVLADVADRLPNWVTFATAGMLLLAIGFTLLARRDTWERAQQATQAWWEHWTPEGS